MNGCKKYHEMISQLLDDELTESQKTELIAHISGCRECERLYNAFASISLAIEDGLQDPPDALRTGIMNEIRSQKGSFSIIKMSARKWGRFVALAACLAVVVFAASKFDFFSGRTSEILEAPQPESISAQSSGGTYGTVSPAPQESGEQNPDSNNGADDDSLITATPFSEEERTDSPDVGSQDEAPSGGQDQGPAGDQNEENVVGTVTDQPTTSAPSETEAPPESTSKFYSAVAGDSVSLLGITAISVYEGQSDEPDPDPIMTVTDEESILFIMDLLEFSEAGDEVDVSGAPIFIFQVTADDESAYSLSVWIVEGRLCCVNDTDGVLYVAAGDAGDLFALIADA